VETTATSTLDVTGAAGWRDWLARHGRSEREVWLVVRRAGSPDPGVGYAEAIEHALCFGWSDSQARKRDAGSFHLRFSPRTARSRWSRVNRGRAGRAEGATSSDGALGVCSRLSSSVRCGRAVLRRSGEPGDDQRP
jgi:uncharacterized protein YdeI (YjbR/CyaY-like superfamily)